MINYRTAESVTEGHPDKVCDLIADTILDGILARDKDAHVAVEVMITKGACIIAGEINTSIDEKLQKEIIARSYVDVLNDIGYAPQDFALSVLTHCQSKDINRAVCHENKCAKDQGAGDQGVMYGYATRETLELMPLPIMLAHKLAKLLTDKRKDGTLHWAKPDGKTQVTVKYNDDSAIEITSIVISTMHDENVSQEQIYKDIMGHVIMPLINLEDCQDILINPSGRFVEGGPSADTGLTGRKLMVDTYGGLARHGGGALSGKDPSKVDRSGAYMCRKMAIDVLKLNEHLQAVEVSLAYAIGKAEPTMVNYKVTPEGTKFIIPTRYLQNEITPEFIIKTLDLKRPIYKKTAAYGHFGKALFPWER